MLYWIPAFAGMTVVRYGDFHGNPRRRRPCHHSFHTASESTAVRICAHN
jgi:hypothetical protein